MCILPSSCHYALFIIVAIVPCILGQPAKNLVPDVNPEAYEDARNLALELWPNMEEEALNDEDAADRYSQILTTFREAALRADGVQNTRVGQQLQAKFTGENPKYSRAEVVNMVRTEFRDIRTADIGSIANIVAARDQDPNFTNEMVEQTANGLMGTLGLDVRGTLYDIIIDLLETELISMFILCLITPASGGGGKFK